jgi:hypothetical protein
LFVLFSILYSSPVAFKYVVKRLNHDHIHNSISTAKDCCNIDPCMCLGPR